MDQRGASEDASRWRRLANLLIDLFVYALLSLMIGMMNAIVVIYFGVDLVGAIGPLFDLGALFTYYFVTEAVLGRTVGKFLTGTKVVAESDAALQARQILLRTLLRFVPFEPISFLGRRQQGWHDRWSRTRVVIVRPSQ